MMTTLAALFARCRWCCRAVTLGAAATLGSPLSRSGDESVLTLYTTPVVYLFFDRLRLRFSRKPKQTVTE
ncbi:multidrug resistance protein [Escherichia coli]|uniref:Multidrug resistance protein n=1 Tax=Escherichia coli TaxID=562 RepID=A0A377CF17_ECOLX|nr:multidrug resistance protein [Escherichia coli]